MIKIRSKKRNYNKKGFGNSKELITKSQKKYWIAIELNKETFEGENMDDAIVEDLVELHHISILKIESKKDAYCVQTWCNEVSSNYISQHELLAELYVQTINDHALSIGANVARIYHNSKMGDTRLCSNSIGHIFGPTEGTLPKQALAILKKYVTVEKIVPGDQVTLWNRLGNE